MPRQRPLRHGKQTNFKLIIHSHSSVNPANLVKIGPLDVELISLTAVVNNKKQQQIAGRTVQQPGGLNYFITIANKLSPWGRRDSIPRRWQFDSRRISSVLRRIRSPHKAKLQAASVPVAQDSCAPRAGTDRRTDGRIAASLNAPPLRRGHNIFVFLSGSIIRSVIHA